MVSFHQFVLLYFLTYISSPSLAEIEHGYGYQMGQISMNESEITILINSTFEIIEDFENETEIFGDTKPLQPLPEEIELTTPPPTTEIPPSILDTIRSTVRMRRIRPSTCTKYTEAQKYKILETAGGRNQLFMADSVDEAGKNFASLYPEPVMSSPVQDHVEFSSVTKCDSRCQMIKSTLNQEIGRRDNSSKNVFSSKIRAKMYSDAPAQDSGPCLLGNFIPIGTCTDLGELLPDGEHESLCSECRGLFMLTTNCFPRIFNAVQCNSQEMGCIFDTFTDKAHGQCSFQSLAFKVLRNVGDDSCEDWVEEQILLPIACQCSLSRNSFLRAKPSKEL